MVEKKHKANTDYTQSAVNLTNSKDVGDCLTNIRRVRADLDKVLEDIEKGIPPELRAKRTQLEKDIVGLIEGIKLTIDEQGSYQDIEQGFYALKQRRVSITYSAYLTRATIGGQLADIVIEPVVNKEKLEGLVKGGLVSQESLAQCGTTKETYVYIIK